MIKTRLEKQVNLIHIVGQQLDSLYTYVSLFKKWLSSLLNYIHMIKPNGKKFRDRILEVLCPDISIWKKILIILCEHHV